MSDNIKIEKKNFSGTDLKKAEHFGLTVTKKSNKKCHFFQFVFPKVSWYEC
jgi:hypothetical protein